MKDFLIRLTKLLIKGLRTEVKCLVITTTLIAIDLDVSLHIAVHFSLYVIFHIPFTFW